VWISFKRSVITSRGEVPTRPLSASTSQEDEAPVRTRSMPVTRDEVLRTIARVAGGSSGRSDTSGPKRSPAQEAAEALMSAKRTLIVLDQVEELPDFDKLELVSLLEFFKGLSLPIKVLVTSARYVSDIALPLKLGPMSDKEMGELIDQFADRHLVDIPSEEREKLLRNAQGLPLVAEWAVGRIALGETPSAVVEQIKASATTLAPVMNYIFAASRTYLEEDADAREVLRTLALFHPHTPVGARTVATGAGVSESTALAALRQLYMHHLVHQTTGPRYSLAPSMQERAVALLHDLDVPPRDDAEVRLRMLQEYFEVARQWGGPDWVPQRKDRDYPFLDQEWAALCELSRWYIDRSKNLGANARGKRTQEEWDKIAEDFACMWIVSLPVYAEVRGHWRVCEEFLTAVQIRLGAVHEQRLGATIALARFAALRGDRDAAHIFLDRAAPALRRASAQERYAYLNTRVLASLRGARPDASGAWTEADDADFDEAYTEFRRAVEQKHTLSPDDQRRHVIDLRRYQGFMQQRRGNIGEAHTAYAQMLKYANGRWKRAELHAECLLAGTARRLGNLSETKRLLEDAEQLETDLKDMPGRALLLAEQAAYLRERKRTAQADQREEESKRLDHTMRGDAA
ncbi:MAG TPA: hypothetical protein VF120_04465, partial [Ktedonobacterales bacterium]